MKYHLYFLLCVGEVALSQYDQDAIDSGKALADLSQEAYDNAFSRLVKEGTRCTKDNVRVRKEWRNIPDDERIDFIRSVECLMDMPSLYLDIDGARSRFDDFGVLHNELTPFVHLSASFLLFHRYYIWVYEELLRNECGYKGAFPYWDWGQDAHDLESSPIFNGSPTSMGSNGEYRRGGSGGFFGMPPGTGGGCLIEGPFSDRQVHLGPGNQATALDYNPRCISRDLNTPILARWASFRNTTDTILDSPNIEMFQALIQGDARYREARPLGPAVHGGGHFSIGGDPAGDFNWSPLDPAFYLHHGQIDRLYFVWQNLDWEDRQGIYGTGTMNNRPPSRQQTLEDTLDLSPLAEERSLGELIDTIGGPFCFIYE